ncbi:MAG: hypothetical protein AB1696_01900 [Planctomycetota bacterium]
MMARRTWYTLLLSVVLLQSSGRLFGWGVGHNDSSRLGATLAPEPFKSNPDLCLFADYADAIQDHAVGHGRDGYMRRLMTFEAIDALRAGDVPKAMFFASAATHYLTDRTCIAHSGQAWYGGKGFQPFLAAKHQGVKVPFAKEEVYYEHLKGYATDTVLKLPPPDYCREIWDKYKGSTNAYFDELPSSRGFVNPEMLRTFDNWTFNDAFLYGRWHAAFIALDMLDEDSIKNPPLRFADPRKMRAVCIEELINGAAVDAGYFSYLVTAAGTDTPEEWAKTLPPKDRLVELADPKAVVVIGKDAPWCVERAALVLAMELARADKRRAAFAGGEEPKTDPESLVVRYDPAEPEAQLAGSNLIALARPEDGDLLERFGGKKPDEERRGLISEQENPFAKERKAFLLAGASRQDTIYLVDYFLDLAWAPIHGRWPVERVVAALQETWGGWKLIQDMRTMHGKEAVDFARKRPYRHQETRAADSKRYNELLGKDLKTSGNEEEWYKFFLLKVPLPDGRRAVDIIQAGTDYTELLKVAPNPE